MQQIVLGIALGQLLVVVLLAVLELLIYTAFWAMADLAWRSVRTWPATIVRAIRRLRIVRA